MSAKIFFLLCSSALLLLQTISTQYINAGEIDVTNIGVTGNCVGLASKGYGSGLAGTISAGVYDVTNIGIAGNVIGLASTGYGSGLAGNINAGVLDVTNLGVSGNGIGLLGTNIGGGLGSYGPGLISLAGASLAGPSLAGASLFGASLAGPALTGNSLAGIALPGASLASCGAGIGLGNALINDLSSTAIPSSGGAFTVTSSSPIAPSGITVQSENYIEGPVAVIGQLPFLATVALDGLVPSGGAAGVSYSCGDGNVAIEGPLEAVGGISTGLGLGTAGLAGIGLAGAGLAGAGLASAGLAGAGLVGAGLGGIRGCGCGGALY